MVLNPDSLYYGGYFKAQMSFPKDYPYSPPGWCFCPRTTDCRLTILQTSVSLLRCGTRTFIQMVVCAFLYCTLREKT